MPLINFKTNLTALQYGLDRPGGGFSGQPYIQNPIEGPNTPTNIREFYELNRTSLDFPIRGGAIQSLVNGSYASYSATIDRKRIEAFFKDAPRGTQFIQKQIGLQLTNPRTQVPNSLTFAGLTLGNAVLPVTQTYNPLNTLAQVQVQGTGAHFNRHGIAPTLFESERRTYQYLAGAPQFNTPTTNRLLILKAVKLNAPGVFNPTYNDIINTGVDPETINRLGISPISNQLFNYIGGPGSVYGIGNTRIFRATNSQPVEDTRTGLAYSSIALTYSQLSQQSQRYNYTPAHPIVQDFRAKLVNDGKTPVVASTDYYTLSLENRLKIGKPGAYDRRVLYTDTSKEEAIDKLNALNPFYFNPDSDPWTADPENTNDMIKFAFECLSNDDVGKENASAQSAALVFRAFLEGTISDNHRAEYNTFKYLGRGETFRTYQGFDRSLSFTFKIFIQTRSEMAPLYRKLNHLISQVYPDYSPKYNLMRGNVVRLTIGDYIYRTPGFLENVDVSIDNSNTPWEIVLGSKANVQAVNDETSNILGEFPPTVEPEVESDVRQLPHFVTVSCTFRPILDILPRRQTYLSPFVPLIVNKDNYLNLNPPVNDIVGPSAGSQTGAQDPSTSPTVNTNPKVSVSTNKTAGPNQKKVNEAKPKKGTGQRVPNAAPQGLGTIKQTFIDNTRVAPSTVIQNFAQ